MSSPLAVVRSRRPLRYVRGADLDLDRPPHVRAASGLTWWQGRLVVVQDDARFLGFVDPNTASVEDVALAAGPDGRRVFDAGLGNKAQKPDFEVAFAVAETLVVMGSGGPLPDRRTVVTWGPRDPRPTERDASRLYEALAERHVPAGTALNLEGGEGFGDRVVLAQRGGDRGAPDLWLELPLSAFLTFLRDPARSELPPSTARELALGALDGQALRITDLTTDRWFSAAAERTDSWFDDGEVVGSIIGRLSEDGAVELGARVVSEDSTPTRDKVEGLVPGGPGRFWGVTDPDDPAVPGELLELWLQPAG